ncbi:MAG TPA: hypothetical protein GX731_10870 [Clostridiales bacterium]|nr:hypothetical protein [Clostridiales bacterium]
MKKWKKVLSLVLLSIMMLSVLGACTKKGDDVKNGSKDVSEGNKDTDQTDKGVDEEILKEAPMLAEQVNVGTLPALEERIPVESDLMVESDIMSLGEYGGSVTITTNDSGRWGWGPYTEQGMFRFKQDGSGEVEANVAKDFYANEDATVWTIELREGMKWSDGHPFTVDDIIFYYNHMSTPALNEDRTPVGVDDEGYYPAYTSKPYNCYQVDKDGSSYWAEFEKVDDYKFTVTFAAPKPNFPEAVAVDNKWMFLPKHFFVNYVARKDGVSDDSTFPLIAEELALANGNKDFAKQWDNYGTMGKDIGYYNWDYAIVPQLRSFIAVKDNWNQVGETYELVRNPYFWKVDSEGRQLPYVDSLKVAIINDSEQIVLKQTAGEIDISYVAPADYSTVVSGTQATHTVIPWSKPEWQSGPALALNQTVKDMDKRELFQDIRFREALSISVDRNLMNATLMNGQAVPQQASPVEGAGGYNPEWTNKWTEYDIDKANALMDELTEAWDRADGTYRKMKGSNRDLEIVISITDPSVEGDYITLLQSAYKAIGIKILDKVDAEVAKSILINEIEAKFEGVSVTSPAIRPDIVVPMRNFSCWYGAYGKWYEDGKTTTNGGVEPTGDMLELINAYDAIKSATGSNREQIVSENVDKIYKLHQENIWIIGFLAPTTNDWVVNNNIKNFPSNIVWADEYRFASMMRPEQLYFTK